MSSKPTPQWVNRSIDAKPKINGLTHVRGYSTGQHNHNKADSIDLTSFYNIINKIESATIRPPSHQQSHTSDHARANYYTSAIDCTQLHLRKNSVLFDTEKSNEPHFVERQLPAWSAEPDPVLSRPLSISARHTDADPLDAAIDTVNKYMQQAAQQKGGNSTDRTDIHDVSEEKEHDYNTDDFESEPHTARTNNGNLQYSDVEYSYANTAQSHSRPYTSNSYIMPQRRVNYQYLHNLSRPRTSAQPVQQQAKQTHVFDTELQAALASTLLNQPSTTQRKPQPRPHTSALKVRSAYDSKYATSHVPKVFDKYQYWLHHSQRLQQQAVQKRNTAKTLVELENEVRRLKLEQERPQTSIQHTLRSTTTLINELQRTMQMTLPETHQSVDLKSQTLKPLPRVAGLTHRIHTVKPNAPVRRTYNKDELLPLSPRVAKLAQPQHRPQTSHGLDTAQRNPLSVVKPIEQDSRLLTPARNPAKFHKYVEEFYDQQLQQWRASEDDSYLANRYPPAVRAQMYSRRRKQSTDSDYADILNLTDNHSMTPEHNTVTATEDAAAAEPAAASPQNLSPTAQQPFKLMLSPGKQRNSLKLNQAVTMLKYEQDLNDAADNLTKAVLRAAYVSMTTERSISSQYRVRC